MLGVCSNHTNISLKVHDVLSNDPMHTGIRCSLIFPTSLVFLFPLVFDVLFCSLFFSLMFPTSLVFLCYPVFPCPIHSKLIYHRIDTLFPCQIIFSALACLCVFVFFPSFCLPLFSSFSFPCLPYPYPHLTNFYYPSPTFIPLSLSHMNSHIPLPLEFPYPIYCEPNKHVTASLIMSIICKWSP